MPVHARVPGDVVAAKKGKGRVVNEKTMTWCNSVWVSFVNRVENGGSFAKEPAPRELRRGPRSVGRVHAPLLGSRRVCMRAGGTPGWA